jgi:hypothetical protein
MFDSMNPTKLAGTQDIIISTFFSEPSHSVELFAKRISEDIKALEKFNFLLAVGDVTGTLPKNNLQIRQWFILGALYWQSGRREYGAELFARAVAQFNSMIYKKSGIYCEGYSYFLYVKYAFDFYYRASGYTFNDVRKIFDDVENNFSKFSMLNREMPFTDTILETRPAVGYTEEYFSNDHYSIWRKPKSCLFISHNPEIILHRKNRHVAPDFGHFVFWCDGMFAVHHPWYKGYSAKQARPHQERDYLNVPKGSWNKDLWWRYFSAPELKVTELGSEKIILRYDKNCTRTFDICGIAFKISDCQHGATSTQYFSFY